jgi:hypothetical protein
MTWHTTRGHEPGCQRGPTIRAEVECVEWCTFKRGSPYHHSACEQAKAGEMVCVPECRHGEPWPTLTCERSVQ